MNDSHEEKCPQNLPGTHNWRWDYSRGITKCMECSKIETIASVQEKLKEYGMKK